VGRGAIRLDVLSNGATDCISWALASAPASIAGAALFFAGAWFGIAGTIVLGRNRTAYPRPLDASNLVKHGIYARVRHPLYTSLMLLSAGWALLWQSLPSLVAAVVMVPFLYGKSRREEHLLAEKFPHYADYARRVPRFLPRIGIAPQSRL
jgi:protein-S-isoprenylcysteine O-methyltransferase Ste14